MKTLALAAGSLMCAVALVAGLATAADACLVPAFRLSKAQAAFMRAYMRMTSSPGRASRYDALIAKAARKRRLSPRLLKAVMAAESGFDPRARSPRGAVGLMQVMPATAAELGVRGRLSDPAVNIEAGAAYLALLRRAAIVRFGAAKAKDSRWLRGRIIAAYNAGPRALSGKGWCLQTRLYVQKVLLFYDLDFSARPAQELTAAAN